MALIVFLRGVNVGGHRTFRPSLLARDLSGYEVVNIGAAGTFVVHKPGPRASFAAELRRRLPFDADLAVCDSRDLLRLESENPFHTQPPETDLVRFVTILTKPVRVRPSLPLFLPAAEDWLVRLIESRDRFVFGVYRRRMKTIRYLGGIDQVFKVPATTRNWNTILAVIRILKNRK